MNAQTQFSSNTPSFDEQVLNELLGRAINDVGATSLATLVLIGDELGLYRGLAAGGPQTSAELAQRTQHQRALRARMAECPRRIRLHRISPRQRAISPHDRTGHDVRRRGKPRVRRGRLPDRTLRRPHHRAAAQDAFKTGEGIGWHEHDYGVFHGCARFFRPGYIGNLVQHWIPSLDGVKARLESGIRVADVGCGCGYSTILMAQAFPNSPSSASTITRTRSSGARARPRGRRVGSRCSFEVGGAKDFAGEDYDFITVFDALHDMGDPAGAARHILSKLAPGGTWMIVEPYAGDRVEENLNPIGRAYYAGSTLMCTPCSLSQEVGLALGAQAGEARVRAVVVGAGFRHFRRAMHRR